MPKFVCSYAHDINCFADFVVEAKSENAALRKIRKALQAGKFQTVDAAPCWENGATNERVFVQGVASDPSPYHTLEELVGQDHLFSPHTNACVRCGKTAEDHAIESTPVKFRTCHHENHHHSSAVTAI